MKNVKTTAATALIAIAMGAGFATPAMAQNGQADGTTGNTTATTATTADTTTTRVQEDRDYGWIGLLGLAGLLGLRRKPEVHRTTNNNASTPNSAHR